MKVFTVSLMLLAAQVASGQNISDVLTLEKALQRALENNLALKAGKHQLEASRALIHQAGLWENPELELETEEFARSGVSGFDAAELSLVLSQTIPFAGKKRLAMEAATVESEVQIQVQHDLKLEIEKEVQKAFLEVVVAQQKVQLFQELLTVAEKTHEIVTAKVDAGKEAPLEAVKSKVTVGNANIRLIKARKNLDNLKLELVSHWGSGQVDFQRVQEQLPEMPELPELETLLTNLANHPSQKAYQKELQRNQLNLKRDQKMKIPDLTVKAGVQRFEETGDSAYTFGLSIPLNIFNRNQGQVVASQQNLLSVQTQAKHHQIQQAAMLRQHFQNFHAARQHLNLMQSDILPAAQLAFDVASEGYREGKFGFLEVLDAQRTLFQTRLEAFDLALETHFSVAEIQYLAHGGDQ